MIVFACGWTPATFAQAPTEVRAWEAEFVSSGDETKQKTMIYAPRTERAVPMIVVLHSWSADYTQTSNKTIEKWCIERGYVFLHPDFRGPNNKPEATGSDLVVADILSAVAYAKTQANIDEKSIYLIGASGGGYTALIMAGRHPEVWAGVSAWVPITDLAAWHAQCAKKGLKYARDLEKSCGGKPGESDAIDAQYKHRSPLTHLPGAKGKVDLQLGAGVFDGHKGSVPISHTLRAFNAVAEPQDRLTDEQIQRFTADAERPADLEPAAQDPRYGRKQPLFVRRSARASVTIFDGTHEMVTSAALAWVLELQRRTRDRQDR
ncbi:MAG: alpha/beta hydrolase family protein [Phycisphaeraceae bacterium]